MEQGIIEKITQEINSRSKRYDLGKLQHIRKEILGLKRLPDQDIFTSKTTFADWAFHHGGRKELQFNIGLESTGTIDQVRFGVAFSLERSQSLPTIDILVPKIALFNDYMQSNPDAFSDMRMWHYQGGRSTDYAPSTIPTELITEGVFIFLGIRQPIDKIDYEAALNAMGRLLPLYLYTETQGNIQKSLIFGKSKSFNFVPGCTSKSSAASASYAQKQLDIKLRHNDIQEALYHRLSKEHGSENVGTELSSGKDGTSVDLVVKHQSEYWFYEIKTAHTAKACIRQAIGQLLEYSYWPNNQEATRLVIVGEPILDEDAENYIDTLKSQFNLPLFYESIEVEV